MNKKIIIFNWKMAPNSLREAQTLAELTRKYAEKMKSQKDVIVAAPFVYLENLSNMRRLNLQKIELAAQNLFWANPPTGGAYTGEISAKMLKNVGVKYVIIGHSERRKYLSETDEMINKKIKTALKAGLKVVLCVGEPKRESGIKGTSKAKNYVKKQLKNDLKDVNKSSVVGRKSLIGNILIAYEPVWSISTGTSGKTCKPEDALEMIEFIKSLVAGRWSLVGPVLYGGSVDSKNITDFLKHEEIDGVLVGAASLKPKEVEKILK